LPKSKPKPQSHPLSQAPDGRAALGRVLAKTRADVQSAKAERAAENAKLIAKGKKPRGFKESLSFAIYFAKHMSSEVATALVSFDPTFQGVRSGENISQAARGPKRLDINYSTSESGLGLAMSFKSVHFGERMSGNADFTHNKKRNDEELRVEATEHHLRQPYSVFVGVLFLPFESCSEQPTSSFGEWVEYLWPLKGRVDVEDPPDRFELVFVALYERDGSELGFYEVGGPIECPRHGRPKLLTLAEFLKRVKAVYDKRNGKDFFFEGERPTP
jgi:hypothetical protein